MSWVVSSRVVPCVARSLIRNSRSRCLESTSRPMVGSSRISSARRVQQRGGDLGAHPLAQRELAHRDGRGSRRARAARRVRRCGWPPAAAGRARGSRPGCGTTRAPAGPTTAASAGRTPRRSCRASRAPVWHRAQPAGAHAARGRHQDAGEHLDGGRLAGAVRADVADGLARLDGERQPVDRGERRLARTASVPCPCASPGTSRVRSCTSMAWSRCGLVIRRLPGSDGVPSASTAAPSARPQRAARGAPAEPGRQPVRAGQAEHRHRRQVGGEGHGEEEPEHELERPGTRPRRAATRRSARRTRRRWSSPRRRAGRTAARPPRRRAPAKVAVPADRASDEQQHVARIPDDAVRWPGRCRARRRRPRPARCGAGRDSLVISCVQHGAAGAGRRRRGCRPAGSRAGCRGGRRTGRPARRPGRPGRRRAGSG